MKTLKRIRYNTMNSWNLSTAPAYNLKVHNVIDRELQDKVFEMMDCENFYDDINRIVSDFNINHDYQWQAGFNGRSGGYLVLYTGGKHTKHLTEKDFENGRCYVSDRHGWMDLSEAKNRGILNKTITTGIFTYPGKCIDEKDVPGNVLRSFRQLAVDIVKTVEYAARELTIQEEKYTVQKTRKVIA